MPRSVLVMFPFTASITHNYSNYSRVRRLGFSIREAKKRIRAGDYTTQEWMRWAADIHNVLYSFHELDGVVLRWARLAMKVVFPAIPEELKTGVHFTGRHTSNCGEKIWIVDGDVCHDLHLQHNCATVFKSAVSRVVPEPETGNTLYCTGCEAYFSRGGVDKPWEKEEG